MPGGMCHHPAVPAAGEFPFFLAGKPSRSDQPRDVLNPFDGSRAGRTWFAGLAEFDRAADEAVAAAPRMRDLPTCERAAILSRVSAMLAQPRDEVARIVAGEGRRADSGRADRNRPRGAHSRRAHRHTMLAFDLLEVGGVIINDVPTWRTDHMPYGGVKDSGAGREGPRYTIEEMTEPRLLVINRQLS